MSGSDLTDQLRNKTKQFAIGILKLFGPLPKTPETLRHTRPLVKAATTSRRTVGLSRGPGRKTIFTATVIRLR